MITITLRQILAAKPCYDPRDKGLLPPDHDLDAPITFREIAGAVNPADVVWCFATMPGHDSLKRHFAVDYAERVRHLMTDERSLNALAVARRHAEGEATDEELLAASAAARAAARDASAAAWAARAAARAARAASAAAWDAARDASAAARAARAAARAASAAAWDAARDARDAVRDAWDAARDASAAAWDAARDARDAVRDAWDAARDASAAAWDAARDASAAARAAELVWQVQRIIELTDAGRWERSEELQ